MNADKTTLTTVPDAGRSFNRGVKPLRGEHPFSISSASIRVHLRFNCEFSTRLVTPVIFLKLLFEKSHLFLRGQLV
jgi:hypothetical protein